MGDPPSDVAFQTIEDGLVQGEKADDKEFQHIYSLHGSKAAYRRAITELLFFASIGDVVRCQKICQAWKISVNAPDCHDYDKRTPLHLAAAEGCYSVVKWLLTDMQCESNPVDRFNRTPLEDAVRGDHGEVVRLLLAKGAKIMQDDKLVDYQESPLSGYVRVYDKMHLQPEYEINPAELELLAKVGEGEFGSVHRGRWNKTTVAIKVLRRSDAVALGDFRTELNVLQKIHHPHTVQFLGACTQKQPYMIVTEFLPGGSMSDLFKQINAGKGGVPSLRRGVELALGCAKGMLYLHSRNKNVIIHRDLKPANLMIAGVPFEGGSREVAQRSGFVKIADFGLSRSLAITNTHSVSSAGDIETDRYKMTGETGSYRYMAPEVFKSEPYNAKVDIYAYSMILFELLEGYIPFLGVHPVDAAKAASLQGKRPIWGKTNRWHETVPPELKALTERCWNADYDKRPYFEEICDVLEGYCKTAPKSKHMLSGGGASSRAATSAARGSGGGGGGGGCCCVM